MTKKTSSVSKIYWYGMSGVLDETDGSGSTSNGSFNEYVYFNGSRVSHLDSSGNAYFYFSDHLGSARVITNNSGTVCYDADFYPFGGQRTPYTNSCPWTNNYKFTDQERDSESNLDNFLARYDSSAMGRFMSPDPENAGADPTNPQSWNMYSYVVNNPLNFVDPTGMGVCDTLGAEDCLIAKAQCNGFFFGNCSRFGDSRCTIDGITSSCDIAFGAIGSGAAAQCPNNICSGFGTDSSGSPVFGMFAAFASGTSGYFTPGDLANGISEWNGNLYSGHWQAFLQMVYADRIQMQYERALANAQKDFGNGTFRIYRNNPIVNGSHANFRFDCYDTSICGVGRYDQGIHIPEVNAIHDDTVSPWTGPFSFSALFNRNFWEHGFVDLIAGSYMSVFPY